MDNKIRFFHEVSEKHTPVYCFYIKGNEYYQDISYIDDDIKGMVEKNNDIREYIVTPYHSYFPDVIIPSLFVGSFANVVDRYGFTEDVPLNEMSFYLINSNLCSTFITIEKYEPNDIYAKGKYIFLNKEEGENYMKELLSRHKSQTNLKKINDEIKTINKQISCLEENLSYLKELRILHK